MDADYHNMISVIPPWLHNMFRSIGLYIVLFAVGFVIVRMIKRYPQLQSMQGFGPFLARLFVFGFEENQYSQVASSENNEDVENLVNNATKPTPVDVKEEMSFWKSAALLVFCTCGLLGSYLYWGILQEKIMTTEYPNGKFESSLFLVFGNRLVALIVSACVVSFTKQPFFRPPLYMFSFTSLSNVMSSFCQLEALKYISFPLQVLAKSSKMIPVMLMGIIISRKVYPCYDYVVAVIMGIGISTFVLNQDSVQDEGTTTTLSGVAFISGYLMFDSFTSQWQGHLFSEYKLSSYQMMLGVNAFSCFFALTAMLASGEFFQALEFFLTDRAFAYDNILFSVTGATGQMFIFFTIKTFGPLVFTMIMTSRQLISIVLSSIIYGHTLSPGSMGGAALVFVGVGYKIYRQQQDKKKKKLQEAVNRTIDMPELTSTTKEEHQ